MTYEDEDEPTPEEVMESLRRFNSVCGWIFAFFIAGFLWYLISVGLSKIIHAL